MNGVGGIIRTEGEIQRFVKGEDDQLRRDALTAHAGQFELRRRIIRDHGLRDTRQFGFRQQPVSRGRQLFLQCRAANVHLQRPEFIALYGGLQRAYRRLQHVDALGECEILPDSIGLLLDRRTIAGQRRLE